ncbi:MAG: microcystin-dependent protein [Crocinitomicaceae bacterium]|jgi:microcystin-dependent protein
MGTDTYLAEIMPFAGNFAVRGYAYCDGQLLPISQNTALFSIIGTIYGGDGRTTFALPDLRGRALVHPGNGPGLSSYRLGERGGQETVTLNSTQMPSHAHSGAVIVNSAAATANVPTSGGSIAAPGVSDGRTTTPTFGFNDASPNVTLSGGSVVTNNTGGGLSHNNIQPFLCINMEIALVGIFPSRN